MNLTILRRNLSARCIPWLLHRITQLAISVWRKPPKADSIPVAVGDGEIIVRAVFYPYNLNNSGKKLNKAAFRSPPGIDEISAIRKNFVDEQFCKAHAKDIDLFGSCRSNEKKEFRGFAVISAKQIRDSGSEVVDSRQVFVAHADIKHGYVAARHEPLPPWLNDRLDRLKDLAKFIPDPYPKKWRWNGPALTN
jgi:hypothetical protein